MSNEIERLCRADAHFDKATKLLQQAHDAMRSGAALCNETAEMETSADIVTDQIRIAMRGLRVIRRNIESVNKGASQLNLPTFDVDVEHCAECEEPYPSDQMVVMEYRGGDLMAHCQTCADAVTLSQ